MKRASSLAARASLAALGVATVLVACSSEDTCADDPACIAPSPCTRLSFTCEGGTVSVEIADDATDLPDGLSALASPGDVVLRNDRVVAVIDALDHPHYIAPSGGAIVDLATATTNVDGLEHVFQATGLLPGDAARYTALTVIEEPGLAAVQVRGHLDGHPDQPVVTRYEVRPCEPGVRVRTEVLNLEPDAAVWTVTDGWYWGGRSNLPFVPHQGVGFEYPEIELTSLTDAFRAIPYLATLPAAGSPVTYASVACNADRLHGFHSEDVSAAGTEPRVVPFRDYVVFERFVAVADGRSVAPAADVALEVRRQLFGEPWVELRGRVLTGGTTPAGGEGRATIQIARGDIATPAEERTPVTQVTPADDGSFTARVPGAGAYVLSVDTFGTRSVEQEVSVGADGADAGTIDLAAPADLTVDVTLDGAEDHALVLLHPADDATRERVEAHRPGEDDLCAPLLGVPHGDSPACNRVLVLGPTGFAVPPGSYHVYATAGPFATIARAEVALAEGASETVTLALSRLPLQPASTLSGDFHVHGGASFDASIGDRDRVRAFLAANVQVIVATEHDVVHDYADAIAELGASDRMRLVAGVESTGHVLFDLVPDADFPQVIGHWNFWPMTFSPSGPWRGAPWDELAEPGALMQRMEEAGWPADTGVAQLNHPWDEPDFGRDLGFPRAIGIDAREPLPAMFDGTGPGLFVRTPDGSSFANDDYHAQEVMNGSANRTFLAFRALWFYLLGEGVVRAGTANSDSHALSGSVLGSPRNLVWTDTTLDTFDRASFDAAVRAGRMIGTNGPILELTATDASGATRGPSLEPFEPAPETMLHLRVTAAPWVPIDEVRIVVNGEVVRTLRDELSHPIDPFGADGLVRFEGDFALADLIDVERGDAWLIVEAGHALMPAADLDCDGIPDTGDNDGDGVIDARDVDVDPTADTPLVLDATTAGGCTDDVGPLRDPPIPEDRDHPGHVFAAVVPDGQPASFTNPLLLDLDGGGYSGAPR